MRKSLFISILVFAGCSHYSSNRSYAKDELVKTPPAPGIVYSNPRVYNVDYSFEMTPDSNTIDRATDLKLWIPIPREWDSQKAVEIISVQPQPHAEYEDPEHGNRMLFWDFGKEPEKPSYIVDIKYRFESYEIRAEVDPEQIEPYDKTSNEYALYTRSEQTICINPKIEQMAQEAIGDEKNPYLQAKRIFQFVGRKMRYKRRLGIAELRKRGINGLLDSSIRDEKTGEEYFLSQCHHYSGLFVALCRAVGIPARPAVACISWRPWMRAEDLKPHWDFDTMLSPDGLAGAEHYTALDHHFWAEFYVPNFGWIPVDAMFGKFGRLSNKKVIMSKGQDIKIGPHTPQKQSDGYGVQWILLHEGRVDTLSYAGVWNIAKVRNAKVKILHSAPFPVVKYFVRFLTAIILAVIVGGLAGFICFHKFKKYSFIGLSSVVPFAGFASPIVSVRREEQIRCSRVSFVMLFWIFSILLLLILLFPVMVKTDLISWSAWQRFCIIVVCILSVLVSWILAGFFCRKSWIKNKPIRVVVKTILFGFFWIVSACMLGVWIMSSFT